jgi:hypothetical protein
MLQHFFEELWDEVSDFFEDFIEAIFRLDDFRPHKSKTIVIHGHLAKVKPAYVFAERLDHFMKVVFGISIILSALAATFVGFIKLSDLLDVLINNFFGRVVMIIIGISYMLLGLWKLIHIQGE